MDHRLFDHEIMYLYPFVDAKRFIYCWLSQVLHASRTAHLFLSYVRSHTPKKSASLRDSSLHHFLFDTYNLRKEVDILDTSDISDIMIYGLPTIIHHTDASTPPANGDNKMLIKSSLSDRGAELSSAGGFIDKFKDILGDTYDPDTNPDGFVNIGTAENVGIECFYDIFMSNYRR